MVSRIRLAWWREALEKLDHASPPPEPVLTGIAAHLLPAGISGLEIGEMEQGWTTLLEQDVGRADLQFYAEHRGDRLFRLFARLLGDDREVGQAGARWALVDLARRCARDSDRRAALDLARTIEGPARWRKELRPVGMLDSLARRDLLRGADALERPGAPLRMLRMFRHRMTGR